MKLQQKVLKTQIECLKRFAEEDNFEPALMDRGGASMLFHTAPLLPDREKGPLEWVCREITRMSDRIILLPHLGFLQQNSFRYQSNLEEIEDEFIGIKHYLDKWKVNYLEIPRTQSDTQTKIGVQYILKLKKLGSI